MEYPIRILQMIGSLNIGGSQTMIINIYKALDRKKIQFDFIIDHEDHLYYKDVLESMGAKIYIMPSYKGYNFVEIVKAWKSFFENHPEYRILHTHVRSYASIFLPIARSYGVKTIIHSHSTSNGSGLKAFYKSILQYPIRYQADFYLGCSKESGRWLFGEKIVNSNKYLTIKNGIDVQQYSYNEVLRKKIREELNINEIQVVYGHIGRFHESKNYDFLLKVFFEISHKNPNALLLLVGDGALRPKIESKIARLNLSDKVMLMGLRNDIPDVLQAFDCFLFPSRWEGLPVTLVEVQAAGISSIVSDKITKEVELSDSIFYLSIENGVTEWVDKALSINKTRRNNELRIEKSGFDINESADKLSKIYYDMYTKGDRNENIVLY